MPLTTPEQTACSRIIDAYEDAYLKLTKRLTYADRHQHAALIDNNPKTYANKLYGYRPFGEEEAYILLSTLNMIPEATAVRQYVAMRNAVSHLLLDQLGLPLTFARGMTTMPMPQFRRRIKTPELWQPHELQELFSRLDDFGKILRSFLADPAPLQPGWDSPFDKLRQTKKID